MPEAGKLTLAFTMCLREVPMLPQKLLEEGLPSVSRELFKKKRLVKFCAKNKVLNPKLGDWQCRFCAF